MKKLLTIIALGLLSSTCRAQTSIPIKDTALIAKITGNNGAVHIEHGVTFTHRYDYYFGFKNLTAWCNNYKGNWYSNYPYIVKFKYDRHIVQLYRGNVFLYAFIPNGNYSAWFNSNLIQF